MTRAEEECQTVCCGPRGKLRMGSGPLGPLRRLRAPLCSLWLSVLFAWRQEDPSLLPVTSTRAPGAKGQDGLGSLLHSLDLQRCLVHCRCSRNISCRMNGWLQVPKLKLQGWPAILIRHYFVNSSLLALYAPFLYLQGSIPFLFYSHYKNVNVM